jgi:DNA processing protein
MLNEGAAPPIDALHVVGRPLDPDSAMIAIVGTRRPTAAGLNAASDLATGLALEGYAIVSGLAVGIDAAAHRAALDAGGATIAVLGCGHRIDYPKRNRALRKRLEVEGTVLSEHPPETEPKPWMFPLRNRIIAGLSLATIVVEGTIQSGALVTARLALDANREVFAVPGSVRNVMAQGPNELIRRGEAALITRTEHVIEGLTGLRTSNSGPAQAPLIELPPAQREVLAYLDDNAVSVDAISRAIDMDTREAGTAVSMLELSGLAKRTFRGYIVTESGARLRESLAVQSDRS